MLGEMKPPIVPQVGRRVAGGGPMRSYTDTKRSGRCVAVEAGFRGLLIPIQKSGLGVQPFDPLKFSGE